ncbi:ADP-ribosylation_factor [Hexamita inflata]|uniref:ADP-ribosylation factor n=1 Tax=Hexamita inflata TaxID=28002 RepID=A0AA86UIC0_9EUKA|nr:ADP-ribosylation factor [Hexamita inflata]
MNLRKLQINVLMFGLENSGKSWLFNQWSKHKLIPTSPTKGFNVGTIQNEDVSVSIRDFGGQPHLRKFWCHYLQSASVVFFVIDSTQRDYQQIQDAKSELQSLLDNKMIDWVPFLVLFNKSDLQNSFTNEEILDEFGLALDQQQIVAKYTHQAKIMRSSAFSTDQFQDILSWLTQVTQEPY